MIISHRHRFIFIKTRKTGGTSVEKALAPLCGPEDVLTPDHLHEGERDDLASAARNWQGRFNPLRELAGARRPIDVVRIARDFARRPRFYNHMRASSVRARIDPAIWNGYFKFCVERNPWHKMISFYYWNHRGRQDRAPSFRDYVLDRSGRTVDQHYATDWDRYAVGDRVIVDKVCRFENLEAEIRAALGEAGVPAALAAQLELPRLKGHLRPAADGVRYDAETAACVAQVFRREIAAFGYVIPPDLVAAS